MQNIHMAWAPPTDFRYLSSQCYWTPTYDAESPSPGSTTERKVGDRARRSRAVELAEIHVRREFTGQAGSVPLILLLFVKQASSYSSRSSYASHSLHTLDSISFAWRSITGFLPLMPMREGR